MNQYKFKAQFVSTLFNIRVITPAITNSENLFNSLKRKRGREKRIAVSVDANNQCLDFILDSAIKLDPINWLRSSQYFSKKLSQEPGLSSYIVDGRLLISI